jgi:hypothetical protein
MQDILELDASSLSTQVVCVISTAWACILQNTNKDTQVCNISLLHLRPQLNLHAVLWLWLWLLLLSCCDCTLLWHICDRESALQRAEGEKITRVKAAEAEAEASYLQGLGISRQRQASMACLSAACHSSTTTAASSGSYL